MELIEYITPAVLTLLGGLCVWLLVAEVQFVDSEKRKLCGSVSLPDPSPDPRGSGEMERIETR